MNSFLRIILIILIVLLVIAGVYLFQVFGVHGVKNDISKYYGDGVIRNIGSGFLAKGFEIAFDKFDLGVSFSDSYTLKNLPQIKKSYIFYLRIYEKLGTIENKDMAEKLLSGSIKLKVKNSDGDTLFETNSVLKDWFQTSFNNGEAIDLYLFNKSNSTIIDHDKLSTDPIYVEISYIPGKNFPKNVSYVGRLLLRAGGSK